ncbi:MAG TPA: Lrp/AsnC family transcriptional regulator [Solirubrobacterales bacterium]|jgi:DNA-binding Lrp family transcriptional regulator|nr:Lrp/AsnC family transcriptional regulator [Solirubrobacterales bacterium]
MDDPIKLSSTDEKILDLLEDNARESTSKIAEQLGISPGLVRRRMAELRDKGVISKYTVVVDHWKIGRRIEAYVLLKIEIGADLEKLLDKIVSQGRVREAATLAGDEDALIRVRVEDPAQLRETVLRIRQLEGVVETKTLVALDRIRHIPEQAKDESAETDGEADDLEPDQ